MRLRVRAFTLVEVVITILVVGVGLTATLRALPVVLQVSRAAGESVVAQRLATDLLAEVALLPYEDPNGSPVFGPEPDESTATRIDFDDIDDYANWSQCPPQKKDGSPEPGCDAYTRSITVASVSVSDFNTTVASGSSDAKRIIITVTKPGIRPVVLTTVRLKRANREDT